jgi:predicted GNAT family acetyltransferase
MEPKVIHNQTSRRYEIWIGDSKIGQAEYSLAPGEIHFVHTEVDAAEQGKGYAAVLMREALNDVRMNSNAKIVPVCSYVVRYMQQHKEFNE